VSAPATVATRGATLTDPTVPLVVLLHGRGSHEQDIIGLADHLDIGPAPVAFAAVRAPIAEGGGYAWFANRGIGRPTPESLAEQMAWFRRWLDDVAPPGRPVVLVGFSGGAAFAGGLILDDPARFTGAALLHGTLPFDAGVPLTPGRLIGLPVHLVHGAQDTVIPRELLDSTWQWLHAESGAPVLSRLDPGGHGISVSAVRGLAGWLAERLAFVAKRGAAPVGPPTRAVWPTLPGGELTARAGDAPRVSTTIPQQQLDQNTPAALQEQLSTRISGLPGVSVGPSVISVPGARALFVDDAHGPEAAFLLPPATEFAHQHPTADGSLHLALPDELAADVVVKGRGMPHPLAGVRLTSGMVMVFGPRDEAELDVVAAIVEASHRYAVGT
jgi:phospholipase/carboxylesterase